MLTITKDTSGSWILSALRGGSLVTRTYPARNTRREAIRLFVEVLSTINA